MEQDDKKTAIIKAAFDVDYCPIENKQELQTDKYTQIPFSKAASLGVAFSFLRESFKNNQLKTKPGEVLYKATFPKDVSGVLNEAKDGSGFLGSIKKDGGGLAQARFHQVGNTTDLTLPNPINPTLLFMTVALAGIDKKLEKISETQQDIMDFLKQDKESQLKGDLEILSDISKSYKHNWDNESYRNIKMTQVQDIKRHAKHNTIFYQTQIEKLLDKKQFLYANQNINDKLDEVESLFINYRLSLYLYSFSSFIEVMLLGNFNSDYLNKVEDDIREHGSQYQVFYTGCYHKIEQYAKGSVETKLMGGFAKANKAAGKTLSKIPVISKSQVDESLIEASGKINERQSGKLSKTMERFKENRESGIHVFVESIDTVDMLYNEPIELLFDEENIYLSNS